MEAILEFFTILGVSEPTNYFEFMVWQSSVWVGIALTCAAFRCIASIFNHLTDWRRY